MIYEIHLSTIQTIIRATIEEVEKWIDDNMKMIKSLPQNTHIYIVENDLSKAFTGNMTRIIFNGYMQ